MIMMGVQIKTMTKINSLAWYCDRLWLTLVAKAKIPEVAYVPEFVGILRADSGRLKVERPATKGYPGLGMKTGEMAKELLLRILQR